MLLTIVFDAQRFAAQTQAAQYTCHTTCSMVRLLISEGAASAANHAIRQVCWLPAAPIMRCMCCWCRTCAVTAVLDPMKALAACVHILQASQPRKTAIALPTSEESYCMSRHAQTRQLKVLLALWISANHKSRKCYTVCEASVWLSQGLFTLVPVMVSVCRARQASQWHHL